MDSHRDRSSVLFWRFVAIPGAQKQALISLGAFFLIGGVFMLFDRAMYVPKFLLILSVANISSG